MHNPSTTTSAIKVQALDIYRAAQLGDLSRCQEIIEHTGPEILLEHDERGHTALHWACLAGHNHIVRFFILCNAPLEKASSNDLGPRPIHWACVNGHILTVDLLLQHGVSINTTDLRGCTPLIIATQYGKQMLVSYLIGKGARKDFTDIDGDTALHWASFKGFTEIAKLLVYSGFNPKQRDDVGQTPVHLACLSGNIEMVRFIIQHEPDFKLKDNNGKTPIALARGRNYINIVSYIDKKMKIEKYCSFFINAFNLLGAQRRYLIFFLFWWVVFSYPMYFYHLSFLWEQNKTLNIIFILSNIPLWFLFHQVCKRNPGYIDQNSDAYDLSLKQVALHKEWEEDSQENPLSRLCHTCHIVRPQRAKHCRFCNRCVQMMDHHCNFANNCIGSKNRVYFLLYLTNLVFSCYIAIFMAKQVINYFGFTLLRLVFVILYGIFGPVFGFTLVITIYLCTVNMTTNERVNIKKFLYLKDEKGHFRNPYDRGIVKNWMEYLNLIPPVEFGIDTHKGELYSV